MGKEKGTIWNPNEKKKGGGGPKGPPVADEEAGPRSVAALTLLGLCAFARLRQRVRNRVGKKQAAAEAAMKAKMAELKDKGCTSWAPTRSARPGAEHSDSACVRRE
jgi:MYXO-CTERM domain-containing protein